jgi:hypothetical protein|tara:strand:+ start:629 stop:811 length:183 start_codon:yes stop_codon:yes gene_type:complete
MIKLFKELVTELKRSNDLKERDIKNKEMNGWYIRANTNITYSDTTYGQSATTRWTGGICG